MLYIQIIAVCIEIHAEHMNAVCGPNVECQVLNAVLLRHLTAFFRPSSRTVMKLHDTDFLVW